MKIQVFTLRKIKLTITVFWFAVIQVVTIFAQQASALTDQHIFEQQMHDFVTEYLSDQDNLDKIAKQVSGEDDWSSVDEILSLAEEMARSIFIEENKERYKKNYVTQSANKSMIEVCDNGGFEQDFLHYDGYVATYYEGSNDCIPVDVFGQNVAYVPAVLPTTRRFEIVTPGPDPLVGIDQTKFGNKALQINSRYGHLSQCSGNFGIDRIVKEFVVTEATRSFTVWYAVVLENPSGHDNQQPFLNIKCDLDPANELCFDADFIDCAGSYMDSTCMDFEPIIDVLDWTCHRFNIPKSEIGNTATLELIVADCGQGAHFGYAYFDGICEACSGSALGWVELDSIDSYSCIGDTIRICGTYGPPDICNDEWWLKSLDIPGYQIENLTIDTVGHTFCFDFPISNFGFEDCLDVYAVAVFTNGIFDLPPQVSNAIEICKDDYTSSTYDIVVGSCQDNTPAGGIPDNNISDDYYYVYLDLMHQPGDDWLIERQLYDPYPNEIDTRAIAGGFGSTFLTLGPFKIQEGAWKLIITFAPDCVYEEDIIPPPYCSGCDEFEQIKISNVQCYANDTWSFDIYVPSPQPGTFTLFPGMPSGYSYNTTHTIQAGPIMPTCISYTLTTTTGGICNSTFIVCPPKPCSSPCYLDVYVEDIPCEKDLFNNITYWVQLEVYKPQGKFLCYEATGSSFQISGPLPGSQLVGPFTEDIILTIYLCDDPNCAMGCTVEECFKTIYVPVPDCNQYSNLISGSRDADVVAPQEVKVYPNPLRSDELILGSTMPITDFEIYDTFGKRYRNDEFTGEEYRIKFDEPPGLYFLRYKISKNKFALIKIIKL